MPMDTSDTVIGAFSEPQVEHLTGVSGAQLRRWARTGFFKPSFDEPGGRGPFSHIYSFRDVVALRVLNSLRNVHNVSMPELRKASAALSRMGENVWTSRTLWVHRGKVVFEEPKTKQKREVTTPQYVADIPLRIAVADMRSAIVEMNKRDAQVIGLVSRSKYVSRNALVIKGTRIPVRAIKDFAEAGYSVDQIMLEYPTLTVEDVQAALAQREGFFAA
jgi:uncharacterized protein (DUF433 family)